MKIRPVSYQMPLKWTRRFIFYRFKCCTPPHKSKKKKDPYGGYRKQACPAILHCGGAGPSIPCVALRRVRGSASPNPKPSHMPAARAITFFTAPPTSTPITSFDVKHLNDGEDST